MQHKLWGGKGENSVNSGAAREMFVQLEPGEYLLECSSTGVPLKFDTNNLYPAGKLQPDSSVEPRQLWVDEDGRVRSKEATARSSSQQDQRASPLPSGGKGWGHAHHPYVADIASALSEVGGGFRERSAVLWLHGEAVIGSC